MRDDAGFRFGGAPQQFVPTATHLRAKGADLAALHHWELSDVSSVFGGVLAGWVDIDRWGRGAGSPEPRRRRSAIL